MKWLRADIARLRPYVPGEQPAEQVVKLNANENPYPPSPRVMQTLSGCTDDVRLYPDAVSRRLCATAARVWQVAPENVIAGNGSDDVLTMIMRTFLDPGDAIAVVSPSYTLYDVLASIQGARTYTYLLTTEFSLPDALFTTQAKCVFLPNPNAQTGTLFSEKDIRRLCEEIEGIVVIDEAYADFAGVTALPLLRDYPHLIITRTLSKSYSCAGLRCGFGIASPDIIAALLKVKDSYNVNAITQRAGCAALEDDAHMRANVAALCATRAWVADALTQAGWHVVPSAANFLLARPPATAPTAKDIYTYLAREGYLVRHFDIEELRDYLRFSLGTDEQMHALISLVTSATKVTEHTGEI